MRILLIDGPGTRPEGYARLVAQGLREMGHRAVIRSLKDVPATWRARREVRQVASLLIERTHPDVIHVLSEAPWMAESFMHQGAPVLHTTADRPSHTNWIVVPSRFGMDRVAGSGEGLDYRVGALPYAVKTDQEDPGVGSYGRVVVPPGDAEAWRWVQEAAWQVPYVPLREEGEWREARFVIWASSGREAWPHGIVEAFAAGRPVIATWGGSAPEFVREGVNGFLSSPGDVASLAGHMKYLWDQPEEAIRMGHDARYWATSLFEPEAHVRTLLRWYLRAGTARLAV